MTAVHTSRRMRAAAVLACAAACVAGSAAYDDAVSTPVPLGPIAPPTRVPASIQDPLLAQRTKGDPSAPVTIYEVTDFCCPWCREFYRLVLPDIEREYIATGKARLIFVNLPIPQLHPNSPAAHEFAMCAAKQDKFWPVHDLLFQHQAAWAQLESPREFFTTLADSAGLDLETLDACFDTGATRWIVQGEAQSVAQQANITSTPSFIMETVLLAGFEPIETWRPILDSLVVAKTGGDMQ